MKDDRGNRKLPKQVQFWDTDEPNTIIVTLHYGYSFEPEGCGHEGVRGFDTAKEAIEAANKAYPCHCQECSN